MTKLFTLSDLCFPCDQHPEDPDWDWVRICADNLADQGKEDEEQALRWLVDNQQWPGCIVGQYVWWMDDPACKHFAYGRHHWVGDTIRLMPFTWRWFAHLPPAYFDFRDNSAIYPVNLGWIIWRDTIEGSLRWFIDRHTALARQ